MINEKELYLITDEKQRLYYTGYQSTDGYLVLGRGFSFFVIDSRYYHAANKPVDMPVAWTKYWGLGRVFYCSLGHHDDVFDNSPTAEVLMERGMLWAGDGKQFATQNDLDPAVFDNTAKMY